MTGFFKRVLFTAAFSVTCVIPFAVHSQTAPSLRLVTAPTASSMPFRSYTLETSLFDGGGVVQSFTFGVHDLIDLGVSWGGSNIVGSSRITWQPHVAFSARVRIVEETLVSPAVALGIDTQGTGPYIDVVNRFQIKSRGAYIVLSRNYSLLGDLGIHAGANYSLEEADGDRDPSFWAGIDKSIGNMIEVAGEYDFAANDNDEGDLAIDNGYLNAALRWRFGGAFTLEFDLRNILRSDILTASGFRTADPQPAREIRFMYQRRI